MCDDDGVFFLSLHSAAVDVFDMVVVLLIEISDIMFCIRIAR